MKHVRSSHGVVSSTPAAPAIVVSVEVLWAITGGAKPGEDAGVRCAAPESGAPWM
jgi:hypothetical protein